MEYRKTLRQRTGTSRCGHAPETQKDRSCSYCQRPAYPALGQAFAIFMAVIGVLGFLVGARPQVGAALETWRGHCTATLPSTQISLNPYTLTLSVSGVSVRDRVDGKSGDEVFGFDKLTVNAELASIAVAGFVVKEIELVGPRAKLVRLPDNRYNISDLILPPEEKKPEENPACRAFQSATSRSAAAS